MLKVSDSFRESIDKILMELYSAQVSNKDLVIPLESLYNYVHVLEHLRDLVPSRWDWDGSPTSKDCSF